MHPQSYEAAESSMQPTDELKANQRSRRMAGRQLRGKTGCLTCRRRKKKCDERKPICAGCSRNTLPCKWPISTSMTALRHDTQQVLHGDTGSDTSSLDDDQPRTLLSGVSANSKALRMTALSGLLLQHYTSETSAALTVRHPNKNAFLTHILPLACSDDLLMHSILAVAGTHLAARLSSNAEVERSMLVHYGAMVEGVRRNMALIEMKDTGATIRLLSILIMLCHFQILDGATDGKFYEHVKACSVLIERLFAKSSSFPECLPAESQDLLGFCLELYAYIMVSNHVSPFGTLVGKPLVLNTDVLSHEHLIQYRTFGTVFAGLYGLYQFMPQIARLASLRLEEESLGLLVASDALLNDYQKIEKGLASWSPPLPGFDIGVQDWLDQSIAAELIRRGLYIYLLTSISGSTTNDFETIEVLEAYACTMIKYMLRLKDTRYQTILLWPALMCGSCLTNPVLQRRLVDGISRTPDLARHVRTTCEALEMLWEDPDPQAFGPYGLHRLKERGYWVPML